MKNYLYVGFVFILFLIGCTVQNEPQVCTLEAMLCPDGSAVGRNSSNNCEFDPCPVVDEEQLAWEKVDEILRSGKVHSVFQTHALEVTLTLHNGTRYTTIEPMIDEIFEKINACGDACEDILIATE